MTDRKRIDFAKLFLRSKYQTLNGEEQEQKRIITALLIMLRAEGYTHEQIAELSGRFLDINIQPGQSREAMQNIYQDAFLNLIITADRRDKACANCPLRTFPFSIELAPTTNTKEHP